MDTASFKNEKEKVILVNRKGRELGTAGKMEAHLKGKLHRAFSIFVFNKQGDLLLQRRNPEKYHSGGLWTNTCCSHPRPGEYTKDAVHRRLMEEMGFNCSIREIFSFIYKVELNNSLIEHEYDHVFFGEYEGVPIPLKGEVIDWKWMGLEELMRGLRKGAEQYTYWFKTAMGIMGGALICRDFLSLGFKS